MKAQGTDNLFDAVIIGDGLAGQMIAAVLAKKGCRVMALGGEREPVPAWLNSSLLMERFLDFLDGRSCLGTPLRFQVINDSQRIDIHGEQPLEDELRRELPDGHRAVSEFLDDLFALGEQIEELIWEHRELPGPGALNRLRFRQRAFRADIPGRVFSQSLNDRLKSFKCADSRKFLRSLFSGFTLIHPSRLTLAECALVWSGLGRSNSVSKSGLGELLHHRFLQFHGEEEQAAQLVDIRQAGHDLYELTFSSERSVHCRNLVFADTASLRLADFGPVNLPDHRVTRFRTGPLGTRLSQCLAGHVVLSGQPSLRVSIDKLQGEPHGLVELQPITSGGLASAREVEQSLATIFPFIPLQLEPFAADDNEEISVRPESRPTLLAAGGRIRSGDKHRLFADGERVLPGLGATGEMLVALSICNHLLRMSKKEPV